MKNKKLEYSILLLTIIILVVNIFFTIKTLNKYREKVNISIQDIIGKVKETYPEVKEEEIISILNSDNSKTQTGSNMLAKYGINEDAIQGMNKIEKEIIIINCISLFLASTIFLTIFLLNKRKKNKEIENMIKYIEEINRKNYNLKIEENKEDEFSRFSNELYKVTVMLKEQADTSSNDKKALQISLEDISHQLKTPLTSISIMLDNLIENPQMDEKTRQKFLFELNRQVEWINWLVISLLKLSKLDSNTAIFVRKEINVAKLINNVIQNLSIPLDIKQQKVVIDGDESIAFLGDYNWQLEAITNIVKNCIEHTPENKNIYINYEDNLFYTKIMIKDEGSGIAKEDIKHIFERFYKGKNSSENSIGIGLALAKSIIEKDNGYIICSSKENEGTEFTIKYSKVVN